jgi:alpha-galactosidase
MTAPVFVTLHSPACTALWEIVPDGAPLWRYWGPRLPDGVVPPTPLFGGRPETTWALGQDLPLSLCPGIGNGWFGQSALLAHRDGADWTFAVTSCRVEQIDPQRLRFHCADSVSQITLVVTVHLDSATDTLVCSTTLINQGDATLDVQWLAAIGLPLPADATTVLSYTGRHNGEFVPIVDPLTPSLWRRENRRGLTSHDCFPGAVVHCVDGTAFGAQLAWSGNHVQAIERCEDGRYHWQLGEWLAPGEARLIPGETLTTPDVLATCSVEGADGVARHFHRAIRSRSPWPGGIMKPRPVHLNTWEACYFSHDEAALCDLANAAAAIGVERFVLDDGWFAGRDNDRTSLGDWSADPRKYPNGLAPLAAHITSLGMEFGLWVEPEMISPDSDLYRAHPDWALQIVGRPLLTGRNQLVLDMARPEVSAHIFSALTALLDALPITYLKWDHNRDLTHAGSTPRLRQQVLSTYALLDRLRARYPQLEIESCAGGGGRIDAGIATRTHRFWASDNLDAVSRVAIQHGFLQFMPPELMGSHVGAAPAHGTGRSQAMAFRCGVASCGAFGVELDPRQLDDNDRATLAAGIARYQRLRNIMHGGQTWRGGPDDGISWLAHGTPVDFVLMLIRTTPASGRFAAPFPLPMVIPDRTYVVTKEGHEDQAQLIAGSWLRLSGFAIPPMRAEQVNFYRIVAQ